MPQCPLEHHDIAILEGSKPESQLQSSDSPSSSKPAEETTQPAYAEDALQTALDFRLDEYTLQNLDSQYTSTNFIPPSARTVPLGIKGLDFFQCVFHRNCQASFSDFEDLKTHIERVHSPFVGPSARSLFICSSCQFSNDSLRETCSWCSTPGFVVWKCVYNYSSGWVPDEGDQSILLGAYRYPQQNSATSGFKYPASYGFPPSTDFLPSFSYHHTQSNIFISNPPPRIISGSTTRFGSRGCFLLI